MSSDSKDKLGRIRYALSLGSNVGDRLTMLREARSALQIHITDLKDLRSAPLYESEPIDCPEGSDSFYNTVIEFTTELSPTELLEVCQRIEKKLGRPGLSDRDINAPRTIDIDVLCAGDLEIEIQSNENSPETALSIPHPRIAEREFVLRPLSDISPDLVLRRFEITVTDLLKKLEGPSSLTLIETNW